MGVPKIEIPGPYRFHFFSDEGNEPPHVHVKRDRFVCKFWLNPVLLAGNWGFAAHELFKIEKRVQANHAEIEAVWHEHFST